MCGWWYFYPPLQIPQVDEPLGVDVDLQLQYDLGFADRNLAVVSRFLAVLHFLEVSVDGAHEI